MQSMNKKKLQTYAILGLVMILLRQGAMAAGFFRDPTDTLATWAMILAAIGFFVFHYELRRGRGISADGEEELFGGPKLHGGLIVALSLFFFSWTLAKGIIILIMFGGVLLLFTKLIRNVNQK